MTRERARLVGAALKTLVVALGNIDEEDLAFLLQNNEMEVSLGPLIDPTAFQDGQLFDSLEGTQKVLRALLKFKKEVKGIGAF